MLLLPQEPLVDPEDLEDQGDQVDLAKVVSFYDTFQGSFRQVV